MNSKDFHDWKRHPVTQIVFSQLQHRISEIQEILSENAGVNPSQDREYVGAIKAYRDLIGIEFEETQEESHD